MMIWLCGSSLLTVFYGHRYSTVAAAEVLAVAAGVAFLNTLNTLITNVFFATGEPALHRRAVAASAITMVITIYPACKYLGIVGGQVAALVAISASYILQIVRIRDITRLDLLRYGKSFIPATLVSGGVLLVGVSAHLIGLGARPVTNIFIAALACMCAYVLCVPIFVKIRQTAVGR